MVNFGLLAAEIVSLVWGTPANFNGFRFLAALLHSQTATLNRGSHLYSAGRPSRWALAHISSSVLFLTRIKSSGAFVRRPPNPLSRCQLVRWFGRHSPGSSTAHLLGVVLQHSVSPSVSVSAGTAFLGVRRVQTCPPFDHSRRLYTHPTRAQKQCRSRQRSKVIGQDTCYGIFYGDEPYTQKQSVFKLCRDYEGPFRPRS